MAAIPGGTFTMGSESGESDEKPVHSVTVGGFCMDVTEVTVDAYAACVRAGQCTARDMGPNCNYGTAGKGKHPINCVDWQEAVNYCMWQKKELPSEEQWEYAARGGREGRMYPWGSAAPSASLLCWQRSIGIGTCEVGSYPAGAYGLKDMAGNVWEWTATTYCDAYSASKKCTNSRVVRGGGWLSSSPSVVRAAIRGRGGASPRGDSLGFRCAR
jgi:formylglycine-generating enzyme required for sulfatase activity